MKIKSVILFGILVMFLAACSTEKAEETWIPVYQVEHFDGETIVNDQLKAEHGIVYIKKSVITKENIGKTFVIKTSGKTVRITIDAKMLEQKEQPKKPEDPQTNFV